MGASLADEFPDPRKGEYNAVVCEGKLNHGRATELEPAEEECVCCLRQVF